MCPQRPEHTEGMSTAQTQRFAEAYHLGSELPTVLDWMRLKSLCSFMMPWGSFWNMGGGDGLQNELVLLLTLI